MLIHLNYHAVYYPESDSLKVDTMVAKWTTGIDGVAPEQIHRENRELLWKEGKLISLQTSFSRSVMRFVDACMVYTDPF